MRTGWRRHLRLSVVLALAVSLPGGPLVTAAGAAGPSDLACDEGALRAAVAQGGTHQFAGDCTIILEAGELEVTRAVAILGPVAGSATIDGGGPAADLSDFIDRQKFNRVFKVTGGSLILRGVNLTRGYAGDFLTSVGNSAAHFARDGLNGLHGAGGTETSKQGKEGLPGQAGESSRDHSAEKGGCIYIAAGAEVTIDDATISDCFALGGGRANGGHGGRGGNGGGGWDAALSIERETGSEGARGGGGGNGGRGGNAGAGGNAEGGAIYNLGTLKLERATLTNNSAVGGEGGRGGSGGGPFGDSAGKGGLGGSGDTGTPGEFVPGPVSPNGSRSPGMITDPGGAGGSGGNGGPGGHAQGGGQGGSGGWAKGGAIYTAGKITVTDSTIIGNRALGGAGGRGGLSGVGGSGGDGGFGGSHGRIYYPLEAPNDPPPCEPPAGDEEAPCEEEPPRRLEYSPFYDDDPHPPPFEGSPGGSGGRGGDGGRQGDHGNGGDAFGGAIFVAAGGSGIPTSSTISGNEVIGGLTAEPGFEAGTSRGGRGGRIPDRNGNLNFNSHCFEPNSRPYCSNGGFGFGSNPDSSSAQGPPGRVGDAGLAGTAGKEGEAGLSLFPDIGSAPKRKTSTRVNCIPRPPQAGEPVVCTTAVTDVDVGSGTTPTGTVAFVALAQGSFSGSSCNLVGAAPKRAECSVTFVPAVDGPLGITAQYGGDTDHEPSSATSDALEVTIHLDPPTSNQVEGENGPEPVDVEVTVKLRNAGNVSMSDVRFISLEVTRTAAGQPLTVVQTGGARPGAAGILVGTLAPGQDRTFVATFRAEDDAEVEFSALATGELPEGQFEIGLGKKRWSVKPKYLLKLESRVDSPPAGTLLPAGSPVRISGTVKNLSNTATLDIGPLYPTLGGNAGLMSVTYDAIGGDPRALVPAGPMTLGPGESRVFTVRFATARTAILAGSRAKTGMEGRLQRQRSRLTERQRCRTGPCEPSSRRKLPRAICITE